MNLKKQISPLGAICLCGLMITGCGHRTAPKSEKNTSRSSIDKTEDANREAEFSSNYKLTEKWLTNGFYTWEENDAVFHESDAVKDKPYGDLIGQMTIGYDDYFKFQVDYFYPDGEKVRLLYGYSPSEVEKHGNSYQIQENGDIVFDVFGGTSFGGSRISFTNNMQITWYFYGEGDYRLNDDTPITKQSASYLEQLNISSPETENKESFQSHTYQFFDTPMSWSSAEEMCVSLGGHLISINSMEEQSFAMRLTKNANAENIWTGGYYNTLKKKWLWTDGSDFSYTNWDVWYNYEGEAVSQPDNWSEDEYCIRYANQSIDFGDYYVNFGGWLDTANESDGNEGDAPLSTFGFICEWSD